MVATKSGVRFGGRFEMECHGSDGRLKWRDVIENLVVYNGLQHILDVIFTNAGGAVATWYLGLTAASPSPANADTMAGGHGGWTEFTTYSESTRVAFVETRTNQQVDNTASKAAYTINGGGGTVGGAFLVSESTKGGATGTLMSAGALTGGNRAVVSGDTVSLSYTFTAADDAV